VAEELEFDPASSVAVGAVGPPGQRAFYLQAKDGYRTLTLLVEKVQVEALAQRAMELLEGEEVGPEEAPVDLEEPPAPDWRAGELGLGLDEDHSRALLVAREAPEDEEAKSEDDLSTARIWLRPAQLMAMAVRGLELVRSGRPLCPVCGQPMDPEGHFCPRKNGKSPLF
jgi:uncharacterized repeat protein (TIGR03847 family)